MGNIVPKLYQVNGIAYNNGPNEGQSPCLMFTTSIQTKDNHLVQCLPQDDKMVLPPHERPGLI
jgi:hypothetical protein